MIQQTVSKTLASNYGPLTELPPALLPCPGLTLSAATTEDISAIHRLDSDPKLSKYLTLPRSTPLTKYPELLDWVGKSFDGTCPTTPLFVWLIELHDRPKHAAGYIEASVVDQKILQIGCVIDLSHQGKGLASKACRTLLQWGTSLPGVEEIRGLCHPRNQKAQNLSRSLGMENIKSRLTAERFYFPNYYPPDSYASERSQMQVWRLLRDQNRAWPAAALPSVVSLDTSMTTSSQ